jgi:hypothetical protein
MKRVFVLLVPLLLGSLESLPVWSAPPPAASMPSGKAPTVNASGSGAGGQTNADAKRPVEGPLIKVTISTSRSEVTSEGGYGVFADLQNVDTVPLLLRDEETMLVVQPELAVDHSCVFAVTGFYPTETRQSPHPSASEPVSTGSKDASKASSGGVLSSGGALSHDIVIQPSEHYMAFWDVHNKSLKACDEPTDKMPGEGAQGKPKTEEVKQPPDRSAWTYLLDRVAFVPGNYAFVVIGKAYRKPKEGVEGTYHTYTDQVKLHVALTQIDAMYAAMLGGLLGYFVSALRTGGDFTKFYWPAADEDFNYKVVLRNFSSGFVVVRNMVSAALVSATVTILMSRISDTQFPIKVSVPDFWGALVVGFIAFFVGNNLINRIVGYASGNSPNRGGGAANPPAGAGGGGPAAPAGGGAGAVAGGVAGQRDPLPGAGGGV